MGKLKKFDEGFTLIELLIVVLLIGILSAIAIPRYGKTVETAKAQDAVAALKMMGMTNRMFRLDNGAYAMGPMPDSCPSGPNSCPSVVPGTPAEACALIQCKYLGPQKWSQKGYVFELADGDTSSSPCGCGPETAGANLTACAKRDATGKGIFKTWTYSVDTEGAVNACGTDVPDFGKK